MTEAEISNIVLEELGNIAPEADLEAIDQEAPLRDELDIDSMDFLNFVIALDERLKIAIPERDYAKLDSVEAIVGYLAEKMGG